MGFQDSGLNMVLQRKVRQGAGSEEFRNRSGNGEENERAETVWRLASQPDTQYLGWQWSWLVIITVHSLNPTVGVGERMEANIH